jgi:hypothetical protein
MEDTATETQVASIIAKYSAEVNAIAKEITRKSYDLQGLALQMKKELFPGGVVKASGLFASENDVFHDDEFKPFLKDLKDLFACYLNRDAATSFKYGLRIVSDFNLYWLKEKKDLERFLKLHSLGQHYLDLQGQHAKVNDFIRKTVKSCIEYWELPGAIERKEKEKQKQAERSAQKRAAEQASVGNVIRQVSARSSGGPAEFKSNIDADENDRLGGDANQSALLLDVDNNGEISANDSDKEDEDEEDEDAKKSKKTQAECYICQSFIRTGQELVTFPCLHSIHVKCTDGYDSSTCGMCGTRMDAPPDAHVPMMSNGDSTKDDAVAAPAADVPIMSPLSELTSATDNGDSTKDDTVVNKAAELFETLDDTVELLFTYCGDFMKQFKSDDNSTFVCEPAAGKGAIVRFLKTKGFKVYATDLYYGKDDNGKKKVFGRIYKSDFLQSSYKADLSIKAELIITNPPFSNMKGFFNRCIELKKPFVLMIPTRFMDTQCFRSALRERHFVYLSCNLAKFRTADGSLVDPNTKGHGWLIFDKDAQNAAMFGTIRFIDTM